jgi:hypothetical protein
MARLVWDKHAIIDIMSRYPEAYVPTLDNSSSSPTIEELFASALPQVSEKEVHAPRQVMLSATTGLIFNRQYRRYIRELFPGITLPMVVRRTRFVIIISEADPKPKIVPWKLETHGEFNDIEPLSLDPLTLQQYLLPQGINNETVTSLTSKQVRNARKTRASTRVFPTLE